MIGIAIPKPPEQLDVVDAVWIALCAVRAEALGAEQQYAEVVAMIESFRDRSLVPALRRSADYWSERRLKLSAADDRLEEIYREQFAMGVKRAC